MRGQATTIDVRPSSDAATNAVPAAIAVLVGSRPQFRPIPCEHGTTILGRLLDSGLPEDDESSRKHAELTFVGGKLRVRDLDSRNGTYLNGQRIGDTTVSELPCVLRTGSTVFLVVADARMLLGGVAMDDRGVVGSTLGATLGRIARAALTTDTLLVTGETGTGKERAARAFHDGGPGSNGPFLAINCATIPHGVAERLLFGTVKGAYSGADAAAPGYIAAADGGTLFLDEIGELDPLVQPKLLRVLETREVLPLGASRPTQVSTRFCFATMRKLRAAMQDGRFRADLFYRIAREEIEMPPLRERREEIPWLVAFAIARVAPELALTAKLVEACLLRPWPGNVRELLAAAERAAGLAREQRKDSVRDTHLDRNAGLLGSASETAAKPAQALTRDVVEQAIAEHKGNLAATARHLGLHRSHFYRLLKQLAIDPREAD
ncbi:MAG TPA: sigma 54-interacting transcriptional regulator [Kofleriaceae bacterium]